ncbi:MAG TPA: hypothetical protein VF271_09000, partial [Rhodanobacteraceae bacterium]
MYRRLAAVSLATVLGLGCAGAHAASNDTQPGDIHVSGKMFVDFTHIDQTNSNIGKTDATGTGLDVKRFYLNVDSPLDNVWSLHLTT